MKWISVKNKLPKHGKGSFLAWWINQGNLMLVCFVDVHNNYRIAGSSRDSWGNRDSCGHGDYPKFSHWTPLPDKPLPEEVKK